MKIHMSSHEKKNTLELALLQRLHIKYFAYNTKNHQQLQA